MVVIESLEYINIPSYDLKKSIDFYTLFLDFEVLEETQNSVLLAFDNLNLKIINFQTKPDTNSQMTLPLLSFIMDVDDFTDAIQQIEQENIPIISGPDEKGLGESILIQDPGGNLIEFFYKE